MKCVTIYTDKSKCSHPAKYELITTRKEEVVSVTVCGRHVCTLIEGFLTEGTQVVSVLHSRKE